MAELVYALVSKTNGRQLLCGFESHPRHHIMILSTSITILGKSIYTFGLFLLLGFVISAFVVWQEGRKDGFDEEKLFDLLLLSSFSSLLTSKLFFAVVNNMPVGEVFRYVIQFWRQGYDIVGGFIGFLIPIIIFTKIWGWSIYRIFDIFSLAASLGFSIVLLAYVGLQSNFVYLFAFAGWIFLYALLSRVRNSKLKSGYASAVFLVSSILLGIIFFREDRHLIFYLLLATLSVLIFLFRTKKMAVLKIKKPYLPTNLIGTLKRRLRKREKDLSEGESVIAMRDPYKVKGRDVGNAEFEDEAEEDRGHEEVQDRRNFMQGMKAQVQRALAMIKIGKYGVCEACGKRIDKARLKAYPEATTCLECAEKRG